MLRFGLISLTVALAGFAMVATAIDDHKLGPDSEPKPGVPKGVVAKHHWVSKIFDGTERDYYVYVPAQYDGKTPAAVMVFQDGHAYAEMGGEIRVPVVFDNLIAAGEMPVTIAIFVDPGQRVSTMQPFGDPWKANNRRVEYDTMSDRYARLLIEEILPEVAKSCKLTDNPDNRAICGLSSGGICAFTVAWQRPDAFRKVVSHIGSFTDILGGEHYPRLIRQTKDAPKPIRVFLQDGENDRDNEYGNWFLANLQMASALKYAGYDYKVEWGDGKHTLKQRGAIFPETLRWLWRDWKEKK
jgi:enterochelin esterase family protein